MAEFVLTRREYTQYVEKELSEINAPLYSVAIRGDASAQPMQFIPLQLYWGQYRE